MPTPAGKPKIGEWIVTPDGVRGQVVRRSEGNLFTVWIQWPKGVSKNADNRGVTMVTEFEYWMKFLEWRIER